MVEKVAIFANFEIGRTFEIQTSTVPKQKRVERTKNLNRAKKGRFLMSYGRWD